MHPEKLEFLSEFNRASWFVGASVILLAFLAYLNSFPGAFILDDLTLVRDNPLVAEPDRLWFSPVITGVSPKTAVCTGR